MGRRKRRSQRQWEEIIDKQERSGLSARAYCKAESIGPTSFYHWRRRLGDAVSGVKGGIDSGGAFLDIGQIGSSGVSAATGVSPWVVTLDLGEGFKLTLKRG
jgi:hypothetical protein